MQGYDKIVIRHVNLFDGEVVAMILRKRIRLAGNSRLKIYGLLTCASGKRMNIANRVFFADVTDAVSLGYRPCGNCLYHEYKKWKNAPR